MRLHAVARGFEPEGALTFTLSLPRARYGDDAALAAFAERASNRLRAVPGVEAVGASQALPSSVALNVVYFAVAGQPRPAEWPTTYVFEVTPGYFRAMGIALLRGRLFDERDVAGHPPVAVISRSTARRFFGDEDPIGRRVGRPDSPPSAWGEIVGVVDDVKDGEVYRLDGAAVMQTYVPFAQNPYPSLSFVVRGADAALPAAVRAAVAEVDADQPVGDVRPLRALVDASVARQRLAALLFAAFAAAALALAALGVYAVVSVAVTRRTGEIGVRMALGARAGDVVRLVLRQGARLVALGLGLGLAGALLLTRLLAPLLFGVAPHDALTLAAVAALLALVAGAACALPARRATRVDPMTALRAE